jgi:hypothetical protein
MENNVKHVLIILILIKLSVNVYIVKEIKYSMQIKMHAYVLKNHIGMDKIVLSVFILNILIVIKNNVPNVH